MSEQLVLPLNFANGTIAAPVPVQDAPILTALGDSIYTSYSGGVNAVMAMAQDSKYKCLRSLLMSVGAGWLCVAVIIVAAGGTAATGGVGSPGLAAAATSCLGAKALATLDMILEHILG